MSSEAGTFHSTPVMGGAAAGVRVALAVGTAEAVLEGDAPSVRVGVGVDVAEGSVQDRARIFWLPSLT